MSKVITEENLKTIDLIKELFKDEIKTHQVVGASLNSERYPLIVKKLLAMGEPFSFENEGDIPFIESRYNWELRIPNQKKEFAFNKFDLPISFKSSLKYLDDYTQTDFDFYIRYNSNESLNILVDDLKFDKNSDTKRILTAYYTNKEKNLDCCLEVFLSDTKIEWSLKGGNGYNSRKAIKLTDDIKVKYGIEIPVLPLPY